MAENSNTRAGLGVHGCFTQGGASSTDKWGRGPTGQRLRETGGSAGVFLVDGEVGRGWGWLLGT